MDRLIVKKAREDKPQEIASDRRDRCFRWKILPVEVIDPAGLSVGFDEPIG